MFDLNEEIEEEYLWNFTENEKKSFRAEHVYNRKLFDSYRLKLLSLAVRKAPDDLADPYCSACSPFEIRYTFNRLKRDDPRETELSLSFLDPIEDDSYYAGHISSCLKNNRHCSRVILKGVRIKSGYGVRSFNDDEADVILDALSDKKLSELTFSNAPLLTDRSYQKIALLSAHPDNQWMHVTLGDIVVSDPVADLLRKTPKISFAQIAHQSSSENAHSSIFSRFLERGSA